MTGSGRSVAPAHVDEDLRDAALDPQVRAQAVAPVAVGDALLEGVDAIPGPVGTGAVARGDDAYVIALEIEAGFLE